MIKPVLSFLITLCFLLVPFGAGAVDYASSSVLSQGRWVKIRVAETGVYKLSFTDLQKMGFTDPSAVSVYGYGGNPLEEDFTKPYSDDVPQTAVYKGTDYILFYGRGPVKWRYNTSSAAFVHENNPYSLYGYYFLTDGAPVKTLTKEPVANGASLVVTTFDDYQVHEKDQVSVNKSGRELFGESFSLNTSQLFPFSVPGITNDAGKIAFRFIAKPTTGPATVSLTEGTTPLISASIPRSSSDDSYIKALELSRTSDWLGTKSETPQIGITYSRNTNDLAHLDYIRLQCKRTLKLYGPVTFFRSIASLGNVTRFVVQGASASVKIWDVTNPSSPVEMETTLSGTECSFTIPSGNVLREFAAIDLSQTFPTPESVGVVANQNLHALEQTDMVIISHPAFVSEAERLAEAHRTKSGLKVTVVTPETVYNEFSSGTPDATAYRRFMKMFYDRASSDADAPKYLLLFGDGAYDNRMITNDWNKLTSLNLLLTYQSQESLNMYAYVTDDYFGFLDDSEGSSLSSDKLDIGIGRFPVRTVAEAATAVNKSISYMENKTAGAWKNNITFVADDGDTNLHMNQANQLAESIETNHPEFLVNKIYFDAYKKDYSGGKVGYPDVTTKIQKELKNGQMVINYTGHGSTSYWGGEGVLSQNEIKQFTYPYLPLWITATCDFARFDAVNTSAGEDVFLNTTSGGIALFTTTRVVDANPNFKINKELINNLFVKKNGKRLTLGDILRETKVSLGTDLNKLNFTLIGDPALTLSYPEQEMKITEVNGEPVGNEPILLKALDKVTIKGEVLTTGGSKATDFSGLLAPTLLDSKQTLTTLDNDNSGYPFSYTAYPNVLYSGKDSVRQGEFTFSFTVPKDISYSNDFGKLSLYAGNSVSGQEAQGAFLNFKVGGTSDTAEKDTLGPEITALYLNDSTFTDGGKVNTTPLFVADLRDQSGVNISGSSIGHDVMLIIDGLISKSYTLNAYYGSIPGTTGEGKVVYSLPALEPGIHTAEFIVWDVQNNSTSYPFTFEVVAGLKPGIYNLTAGPVPARSEVTFFISHNRPETVLDVQFFVYNMIGQLLWSHKESGSSDLFRQYSVTWNLNGSNGVRLKPGVYLYRAALRTDSSREATETKKLIILAQ